MLEEVTYELENAPPDIYDLDLTPSGNWIAVTERGKSQHLSFFGRRIAAPEEFRFPMIRSLTDDLALIVDSRAKRKPNGQRQLNGWIINSGGEVIRNFYAGDAVEDVLVSERFIVISYFDESALTSDGIEGNGVAVFDKNGNYEFGYRKLFGEEAVDIADCYCTCWADEQRIFFFPYTDFPLVSLDLENRSQQIFQVPGELAGSKALSCQGNIIYFHSPYKQNGLYKWDCGASGVEPVGEYSGQLRGLINGQFLSVSKSGYTIISAL